MHIKIIAASKIQDSSPLQVLIQEYLKRITNIKINIIDFPEKNLSQEKINAKIFSFVDRKDFIILCDEKGQNLDTLNFKKLIFDSSNNSLAILIAGADGFLSKYKNKAHYLLSLSKLTFPHQLARLILVEQLYRAYSIYNNHPYHRT